MGRAPVGDCRVGCIGRRSPGRNGGRVPGAPGALDAPPGRGRWKIGCPGTGRPGIGRFAIGRPAIGRCDAPACGACVDAAGLIGALYTGRGPVCGTIIRGGGACGRTTVSSPAVDGSTGDAVPAGAVLAGASACVEVDDGGAGGCGAAGGCVTTGADALCGAFGGAGGGTVKVGLTGVVGTTNFGAGGGVSGAGGTTVAGPLETVVGAAAFVSTCGGTTAGRGGAVMAGEDAAGCCLLIIAFRTSPGREMFDKSILVLISSDSGRLAREDLPVGCASLVARKWARTLSASKSSIELECVFFSVTPTAISASRIALLLTSSSLAKSLIRILLIRPFFPLPLSLHSNLTVSVFNSASSSFSKTREVPILLLAR